VIGHRAAKAAYAVDMRDGDAPPPVPRGRHQAPRVGAPGHEAVEASSGGSGVGGAAGVGPEYLLCQVKEFAEEVHGSVEAAQEAATVAAAKKKKKKKAAAQTKAKKPKTATGARARDGAPPVLRVKCQARTPEVRVGRVAAVGGRDV